jgi:ribose transport system ATP-binding protein
VPPQTSAAHGEVLVDIRGLSKRFGATQALDRVDLRVLGGSVVALLGQNGAGKSTLIKILAGVYGADDGEIDVCGAPLTGPPPAATVAFLHQDLGLVDGLTVGENIALGTGYPRSRGRIDWRECRAQARRALDLVDSDADPDQRVADLSRTDKSLVAIARSLIVDARVVVLDEPTASLPVQETERLFAVLRRLRDQGLGLVYVSHRIDEVFAIADRITVLRDGRVVTDGAIADTTPAELVRAIVGKTPAPPPPPAPGRDRELALTLSDVVGQRVGPVSLSLRAGEVLGLAGLAGAGQSELGRTVAGVLPLYGGSMRLRDSSYDPRNTASAVDRGIGFVTSNRADEGLAMSLTVAENLFPNLHVHGRRGWSLRRNRAEERQAQDLVQRFGIRPVDPTLPVEGLSGGNQQKVIIGRWLSTDVEILVLEEPTAGVDVGAKNEIYQLMDAALDRGVAVLLISTDVQEIAAVSHRALVFRDGLIAQEIDRAELSIAALVAVASGAAA